MVCSMLINRRYPTMDRRAYLDVHYIIESEFVYIFLPLHCCQVYQMVMDMQKDQDADSISVTSEASTAPSDIDDEEDVG